MKSESSEKEISEYELQALVTILKEECENNDINLNVSKTKVLVFKKLK